MLAGQFITTGPDFESAHVHVLSIFELRDFRDFEELATRKGWAPEVWLPRVFGAGTTHAFRATEAMLNFLVSDAAAGLNVPHAESVRAAAACLLLGEPLGGSESGEEGEGGTRARLSPEPDRKPPGGDAVRLPGLSDALRF